jgi:hypothetical protein
LEQDAEDRTRPDSSIAKVNKRTGSLSSKAIMVIVPGSGEILRGLYLPHRSKSRR